MVETPAQCYTGLLRLCVGQHCFSSSCFSWPAMEAAAKGATPRVRAATGSPTVKPSTTAGRGPNETRRQKSSKRPKQAGVGTRQRNRGAPRSATEPLTVIVPTTQAGSPMTTYQGDLLPNWEDNFVLPDVTKPPPGYPFHHEKAMELLHSWDRVDHTAVRHVLAFPSHVQLASLAPDGTWSELCSPAPAGPSGQYRHIPPHGVFWCPDLPYYAPCGSDVTQTEPVPTEKVDGGHLQFQGAPEIQQNQLPAHQGENWVPQPFYGIFGSSIDQDGPTASNNLQWGLQDPGAYNASLCTEPNPLTTPSELVWEPLQHFVAQDPNNDDRYAYQLQLDMQGQCDASTVPGLPKGQPLLPTPLSGEPQQLVVDKRGQMHQPVDSGIGSDVVSAVPENQWRWYETWGITKGAAGLADGAASGGRRVGRQIKGGNGLGSRQTYGVSDSPVTLYEQQCLAGNSNIPNAQPKQGGHGASGCTPEGDTGGGSTEGYHRVGRGRAPPTPRASGAPVTPREDSTAERSASRSLPMGFDSDPVYYGDGQRVIAAEEKVRRYLESLPPVELRTPPSEGQPGPSSDNQPGPSAENQPGPHNHPGPSFYNQPAMPPGDYMRPEHFSDHGGSDGRRGVRRGALARRGTRSGAGGASAASSSSSESPPRRRVDWPIGPGPDNFQSLDGPSTSTDAQAGSSS